MKSAENFIVSSVFSKSLSVLESLLRCWFRGYRVLLCDHSVFSFICALIRVVCFGQFYTGVPQICRLWRWQLVHPLPMTTCFRVFFFPPKSWFLCLLFVYELYSATTSIKCDISFSLCNPFLLKDYQSRNLHHQFYKFDLRWP